MRGEGGRGGYISGKRLPLKPHRKPAIPNFSSGPTAKRPGWTLHGSLGGSTLGRSHRAAGAKAKLRAAISETKRVLKIPNSYFVAIVPASDTGAFEMCMWGLLGPKHVDVAHWESFGKGWHTDCVSQLKLDGANGSGMSELAAPYGRLPDLGALVSPDHDCVFTWNGTTSGVKVPDGDWISADRTGEWGELLPSDVLAFCFSRPDTYCFLLFSWPLRCSFGS
jgi:phosphoserine aminotransferase